MQQLNPTFKAYTPALREEQSFPGQACPQKAGLHHPEEKHQVSKSLNYRKIVKALMARNCAINPQNLAKTYSEAQRLQLSAETLNCLDEEIMLLKHCLYCFSALFSAESQDNKIEKKEKSEDEKKEDIEKAKKEGALLLEHIGLACTRIAVLMKVNAALGSGKQKDLIPQILAALQSAHFEAQPEVKADAVL
ncbi:MAG: hypothetical protein VB108_07370 [Anaerolineaceae bacterium]|nr:hypothetical protein [Anaerolineaceae bacterium]